MDELSEKIKTIARLEGEAGELKAREAVAKVGGCAGGMGEHAPKQEQGGAYRTVSRNSKAGQLEAGVVAAKVEGMHGQHTGKRIRIGAGRSMRGDGVRG